MTLTCQWILVVSPAPHWFKTEEASGLISGEKLAQQKKTWW